MKRRFALAAFAALTLATLSGIAARAQTAYSYWDLGTLGGTSSSAAGVNTAGQVVGAATLANGATHPFYWSSATGMVDIGTFGGTGGGAKGINNVGDVVGHATNAASVWHPFVWNISTHVLTDLNSLLSPSDAAKWTLTYAWKVNDNRQVIGQGTVIIGGTAFSHGFLLDLTTTPYVTITDLGGYFPDGINNLSPPQLSCWPASAAGAIVYPSLVNLFPVIRAYGINNAGGVVGYLQNSHAAYISPAGVLTDLGSWGTGLASANSINNAASPMVVGDSNIVVKGSNIHHAFRWAVGSAAIQDLNSLTLNLGKKSLFGAKSVSDTGYIACQQDPAGSSTTNSHAFLLTTQ